MRRIRPAPFFYLEKGRQNAACEKRIAGGVIRRQEQDMKKESGNRLVQENKDAAARKLLEWYDENRRILPWREDPTPYHVWISEIMLQQTRVEAVREYYERFLSVLPDIGSLADASEDTYLKLWEGLGYYSRVRNLHRAAQEIVEQYGGQMPGNVQQLIHLPGIGPYTAAAIASIAFGKRVPAVDGNLLRIFSRLQMYPEAAGGAKVRKLAEQYYLEWMPGKRPGDFNQALMDLGSGICVPHSEPLCSGCPLSEICGARRAGTQTDYPRMPVRKARKVESRTVLIIKAGSWILLHKRPEKGLLAGLYEFPNVEGTLSEEAADEFVRKLGLKTERIRPLPGAKHIFTHIEWHMSGYLAECNAETAKEVPLPEGWLLTDREGLAGRYSLPSAFTAFREWV